MKKFLGAIWKEVPLIYSDGSAVRVLFGIVAKQSDGDESWKAYCGAVDLSNPEKAFEKESNDIAIIMKHGEKLSEDEARKWFPEIKLKYRN